MSETRDRVPARCPSCSPEDATVHEVLAPGGQATVRCTDCEHVHKTRLDEADTVPVDVVVSQDGESFSARTTVPEDVELATGEEFVLDADAGVFTVRITSLEVGDDRRDAAPVGAVETVWTRDVGNVAVAVTVHPKGGTDGDSESRSVRVPGDHEFVVGDAESHPEGDYTVESVLLRDGAAGYPAEHLEREGDAALAKDVKRVYARDETADAWSAW